MTPSVIANQPRSRRLQDLRRQAMTAIARPTGHSAKARPLGFRSSRQTNDYPQPDGLTPGERIPCVVLAPKSPHTCFVSADRAASRNSDVIVDQRPVQIVD